MTNLDLTNDDIIRTINDTFRQTKLMHPSIGMWVISPKIAESDFDFIDETTRKIHGHKDFELGSDHSNGRFFVQNRSVFWKITTHGIDYLAPADDPTDLKNSRRMLAVYLEGEKNNGLWLTPHQAITKAHRSTIAENQCQAEHG